MRTLAELAMVGLFLVCTGPGGVRSAAAGPESASDVSATRPNGSALTTVAPPGGRALDEERDPGRGPRPHEPVFVEPATVTTEHLRAGLSSWITPSAPFDHREDPGGVAIGLTITGPVPRPEVPSSGPSPWHGSAAR